jgi:hypothetical protein
MKALILLLFPLYSFSQGIILNEISNGTSGSKEFFEFLVVGSASNPLSPVNLTDWIFDDNNGDFDASVSTGVARGHYRFTSSFPIVNPGDIIVIYNTADINTNLPPDDINDSNGDGVYIIPITSTLLERCTSLPSSTSGPLYSPCIYTSSITQTWNQIGLRNGGDAAQIRDPNYVFYHGFSYGDVNQNFPTFPLVFGGGSSFRVRRGNGRNRNYFLDCSDWTIRSNYARGDAINDTPGLPNTVDNGKLINNIKTGNFDYTNLANLNNCADIILANGINIKGKLNDGLVKIEWDYKNENQYELEISTSGINFFTLDDNIKNGTYHYNQEFTELYYRIRIKETDKYSRTIVLRKNFKNCIVYPNPVNEFLYININFNNIKIFDMLGNEILSSKSNKINVSHLPTGNYIIEIKKDQNIFRKKITKN